MAASNRLKSNPIATDPWRLCRWAIDHLLVCHGPFNPLCLVAASRCLVDDIASRAAAAGGTVIRRSGRSLGDEIARAGETDSQARLFERFSTANIVVVDGFEDLGEVRRQATVCELMDTSCGAGSAWCVALARPPQTAGLVDGLVSRLDGGLVISLPTPIAKLRQEAPTISRIIAATARQFGLSTRDVTGGCRSRRIVGARSLAMYLARELTGASYRVIGNACGGRDHSTAMHAIRNVAAEINRDAGLADATSAITTRLGIRAG